MKKIAWPTGHSVETMTVGELAAALARIPGDLPVLFAWEGITQPVEARRLAVKEVERAVGRPLVLMLGADQPLGLGDDDEEPQG